MSTKTKKILTTSIITAAVTVGILGLFFNEIRARGSELEQQISILTENNTKESTSVRVKRLVQETEQDRLALNNNFFANESQSISFLNEIELLARNLGLSLKTEALDKVVDPANGAERIKMVFVFNGQKSTVLRFSEILEVVPYHSSVDSLTLRKQPDGNWEGRAAISITINSL
ncbi:MAG TPA: hypothetical protein PKA42_00095 [Candidatus Paceibacterota bacterium]|nr:hypothetical protein [Candidatus Paceibacterota bacterium]HMO82547.1 hypothetical protein [Candidatus Paceibacterota bacterium]